MPKIPVEHATLYTNSIGTGTPILMICGIASDVASWTPLSPLLENKFRLLSFDNRGAGRTVSQSENWTIDTYVNDALAVLDHYNIPCAHITGHSMGAMIGLRLAAKHPDRVRAMVMMSWLDAPNAKSIQYFEQMAQLYASNMPGEDWFELLFHALFSPEFFKDHEKVKAAALSAASYAFVQTPKNLSRQVTALASIKPIDLKKIQTPVLSLIGQNDTVVLPHKSRSSLQNLPNVTFKTLPNTAHSIHWETPETIAKEVTEFFAAHPL